ncbi:hypothetical protein C8Q80DRAFT_1356470 [Daedaleopsis nitida]|nr:hypothetical protein C8Q80DRAFT_1356470 [Daedaleopsis nitida]
MARYASLALFVALFSLWSSTILSALCSPYLPVPTQFSGRIANRPVPGFAKRTDDEPQFPDEPPSCPICAENYGNIDSCAQAAPVLQNFTMIIFNPGAFIDVIKCACVDTFQSTYPQCVDCFIRTNQSHFLNDDSDELPSVVDGMRKICALESTLLGGYRAQTDAEPHNVPSIAFLRAFSLAVISTNFLAPLFRLLMDQ